MKAYPGVTQFSLKPTPIRLHSLPYIKAGFVKVTSDLHAAESTGQFSVFIDCQHHAAQLVTLLLEAHSSLDFQGTHSPLVFLPSPQTINIRVAQVTILERFFSLPRLTP